MKFETAFVDVFAFETCGCAFRSASVAPNAIRFARQKPRVADDPGTASGQPRREPAKSTLENWIKVVGYDKHDLYTS